MTTATQIRGIKHRIKGRDHIVRSLRSLQIRVHRFGVGRASTARDRQWAAWMLSELQRLVDTSTQERVL